jgi:hypothetical protein
MRNDLVDRRKRRLQQQQRSAARLPFHLSRHQSTKTHPEGVPKLRKLHKHHKHHKHLKNCFFQENFALLNFGMI